MEDSAHILGAQAAAAAAVAAAAAGEGGAAAAAAVAPVVPLRGGAAGASFVNQYNLQKYILYCAQQTNGGLRDKPGKGRDFYHTCYNLSGLSVAQHVLAERPVVFGDPSNLLEPTHPIFNIRMDKAYAALRYFSLQSNDHNDLISERNGVP